jgi:hypothetical protein
MVTIENENNIIFPSEFKSDGDIYKLFSDNHLRIGRMISGSKSGYREQHPDNVVVFNANIITELRNKIFYGDLDLTVDIDNLTTIAKALGEPLYVLREMDARFENEDKDFKFYKSRAVMVIKN